MMYCYDTATMPMHNDCDYWTVSEMEQIGIYPVTPRIQKIMKRDNCTLLPISDIDQYSWEYADCADEMEAQNILMRYLNQIVYEYRNDL